MLESHPRLQVALNALIAVAIGLLGAILLTGLASCAAQAQDLQPVVAQAALDPLVALAGRLGAGSALIYLLVQGAKRLEWLRGDKRPFWLAVGLGLLFGLVGVVEPMPSTVPFVGEALAGLGASALAVTAHSARRAHRKESP